MGILIMVGWMAGLIALVWFLVLRFDPEARGPRGAGDTTAEPEASDR